jgi:hypothetical protein
VFQIGGAGAVGTGSIRGMLYLRNLREGGFSVWPFDPPNPHTAMEIRPRALTGPVTKSDMSSGERYLGTWDIPAPLRQRAVE